MGEKPGGKGGPDPNKIYDGGSIQEVIIKWKRGQLINEYNSGVKIDMNRASTNTSLNAKGFPRNANWFWKQALSKKPEMFSKGNVWRIENNIAPRVDKTWLEFNPSHTGNNNDVLVHHHIDQGRFAVGIPDKIHRGYFKELHNRSAYWFKINKVRSLNTTLNVFSGVTSVIDVYKIAIKNPDAPLSTFDMKAPLNTLRGLSDYENYSFQNYYYEIKSRNKQNTRFMLEFYKEYKKINGIYRGVGQGIPYIGEIKNGKLSITPLQKL